MNLNDSSVFRALHPAVLYKGLLAHPGWHRMTCTEKLLLAMFRVLTRLRQATVRQLRALERRRLGI